jgi:hypothetical protein
LHFTSIIEQYPRNEGQLKIERKNIMNIKTETIHSITGSLAPELNNRRRSVRSVVIAALALWFALVFFLGAQGAFVGNAGSPPLPIFFGVAIPLALFLAAYFGWSPFRDFILGADLRFVAAMQAWRWAGGQFFWLYAWSVLPGLFAFPAGFGDMAIGFSAPWIVLGLVRNPLFAASRRFVIWNILGIVDFVVAVSMGVLSSGLFHGINALNENVTTSALNRLPLVIIPAFAVPLFTMFHLTALFQARQLARGRERGRV